MVGGVTNQDSHRLRRRIDGRKDVRCVYLRTQVSDNSLVSKESLTGRVSLNTAASSKPNRSLIEVEVCINRLYGLIDHGSHGGCYMDLLLAGEFGGIRQKVINDNGLESNIVRHEG